MSIIAKAELLKAIIQQPTGIRELAKRLNHRPENIIALIEEMEEQGLIEKEIEKRKNQGRPRLLAKPTTLGEEYLIAFQTLESKLLRSRRTDLARAVKDAEYAKRLVTRKRSPFNLALELSALVRGNTRNNP